MILLNTIGAFYGGLSLMTDPTGEKLSIPLDFLQKTPFSNYFWPGLILFSVNGLFGLITLAALAFHHPWSARLVLFQGLLLGGWITIQVILLQIFYVPLHLPFLLMGVMLVLIAWLKPEAVS